MDFKKSLSDILYIQESLIEMKLAKKYEIKEIASQFYDIDRAIEKHQGLLNWHIERLIRNRKE